MKRVLALFFLLAGPVSAAPVPWWQWPPEVSRQVSETMTQLFNPLTGTRRPWREERVFRAGDGRIWLTFRREGDDVKEYNREGRLVVHAWQQGKSIHCFFLSPEGRWQQVR